jgi:Holliday junction resolvase
MTGGKAPRAAGDYFERRTRDALTAAGWIVVRSAGSLGAADLVAMKAGNVPLMVSCKRGGYIPRSEVIRLVDAALKAGAAPVVAQAAQPGWAEFDEIGKHGRTPMMTLHFPARSRV